MSGLTLQAPEVFFEAVQQGSLILCPNHRVAISLRETYGSLRKDKKLSNVCPSPNIHAIDVWLSEQWQQLSRSGHSLCSQFSVLGSHHQLLLWQEIIKQNNNSSELLNPDTTARTVSEAYTLMQVYKLPFSQLQQWLESEWHLSENAIDLNLFIQWLREFEDRLSRQKLLSLSGVLARCIPLLNSQAITLPEKAFTFGFSEPPPLYHELISSMGNHSELGIIETESFEPDGSMHSYASTVQEIIAAAQWANETLAQDPEANIGIICPELRANQQTLIRVFNQYCDNSDKNKNFNLSVATPLSELPIVASALSLLSLNQKSLNTLELCHIFRSPYLAGSETEMSSRAVLEHQLRDHSELETSLNKVRSLCHREKTKYHCPDLGSRLQNFMEAARNIANEKKPCAHWISLILKQLEIMGWPGDLSTTQENPKKEEQKKEDQKLWQQLLDNFQLSSSIMGEKGELNYRQAIQLLGQIASSMQHHQFSNTASIQIMSPGEGENLHFTHLWIMGMSEQQWPPVTERNSLIPYPLQKEFGFPHCDKQESFQYSQDLIRKLFSNTHETIIFSYPSTSDEVVNNPAAIVNELASLNVLMKEKENAKMETSNDLPDTQLPALFYQLKSQSIQERISSDTLLPLLNDEHPSGGTQLIANQAICPFKAFAVHRLNAKELRSPRFGLSPQVTGTIVHETLEHIWSSIKSYQQLLTIDDTELQTLITDTVNRTLNKASEKFPSLMQPNFLFIESQRLVRMLNNWLEYEKGREFSEIETQEQKFEWQYEQLTLRLKVDRIERLNSGQLGIVDYKTGKSSYLKWQDPRPDQPQLLLYLLAVEKHFGADTVNSLMFAHINAMELVFKGLTEQPNGIKGLSVEECFRKADPQPTWSELKIAWQEQIENLAKEVITGQHSITPKNSASNCNYCHLSAFCRIAEIDTFYDVLTEEEA